MVVVVVWGCGVVGLVLVVGCGVLWVWFGMGDCVYVSRWWSWWVSGWLYRCVVGRCVRRWRRVGVVWGCVRVPGVR